MSLVAADAPSVSVTPPVTGEAHPSLAFGKLADLPAAVPLDAGELAALLGVARKTIWRAAARGELPSTFRLLGREVWTAGALLDHFGKLQREALTAAARRRY